MFGVVINQPGIMFGVVINQPGIMFGVITNQPGIMFGVIINQLGIMFVSLFSIYISNFLAYMFMSSEFLESCFQACVLFWNVTVLFNPYINTLTLVALPSICC